MKPYSIHIPIFSPLTCHLALIIKGDLQAVRQLLLIMY